MNYQHVFLTMHDKLGYDPYSHDLQVIEISEGQSFRNYIKVWREQAAKLGLVLDNAEAVSMFIITLKRVYYYHLLGHESTLLIYIFINLAKSGEMVVENEIKMGKIEIPFIHIKGKMSNEEAPKRHHLRKLL